VSCRDIRPDACTAVWKAGVATRVLRYRAAMSEPPFVHGFRRSPVFFFAVPTEQVAVFPREILESFSGSRSRLIVGACLSPVLGALPAWFAVTYSPGRASATALVVCGVISLLLLAVLVAANQMSGDWPMYAGATVISPVVVHQLGVPLLGCVVVAGLLVLASFTSWRARTARIARYARVQPLLTSAQPHQGAVVDVTYRASDDDRHFPVLTIEAAGRRLTAGYSNPTSNRPGPGDPVTMWTCDTDPEVAVVCVGESPRAHAFRPPVT